MKELNESLFTIELKPPTKKQIDIIQMTMHGLAKDTYDKTRKHVNFDFHNYKCVSLHKQNQNTFVKRIVNSLVLIKQNGMHKGYHQIST